MPMFEIPACRRQMGTDKPNLSDSPDAFIRNPADQQRLSRPAKSQPVRLWRIAEQGPRQGIGLRASVAAMRPKSGR